MFYCLFCLLRLDGDENVVITEESVMLPEEETVIVLADPGGNVLLAGFVVYALVVQNAENLFNVFRS